jgi:hypothetical protein
LYLSDDSLYEMSADVDVVVLDEQNLSGYARVAHQPSDLTLERSNSWLSTLACAYNFVCRSSPVRHCCRPAHSHGGADRPTSYKEPLNRSL